MMRLKLNLKKKKLNRACDSAAPEDKTLSREAQSTLISTFNYRELLLNSTYFAHGKYLVSLMPFPLLNP